MAKNDSNQQPQNQVPDTSVAPPIPPAVGDKDPRIVDLERRAAQAKAGLAAEEAAAAGSKYKVADGMSITTCRGVVDAGQLITQADFVTHVTDVSKVDQVFQDLVKRGAIVSVDP